MSIPTRSGHGTLTAITAEGVRIDATACDAVVWASVHRIRPPAILTCPACCRRMSAKVSSRGLRFFAHRPGEEQECWLAESPEHHQLKVELAQAVRKVQGWTAQLEVAESGWRADVLATSQDGSRRIAFEAQLSCIVETEVRYRTRRYEASDVEVCWVTDARSVWRNIKPSPSVLLLPLKKAAIKDRGRLVIRGAKRYIANPSPVMYGEFSPFRRYLSRFVEDVCAGRLQWHGSDAGWTNVSDVSAAKADREQVKQARACEQLRARAEARDREIRRQLAALPCGMLANGVCADQPVAIVVDQRGDGDLACRVHAESASETVIALHVYPLFGFDGICSSMGRRFDVGQLHYIRDVDPCEPLPLPDRVGMLSEWRKLTEQPDIGRS
ncbi:MAG: competence protein CoiA [Mycobacterium sp.]